MKDVEKRISDHVKAYRALHGLTQKQMAKLLEISYATYQEMESKGIVRKLETLERLQEKTGYEKKKIATLEMSSDLERELGENTEQIIQLQASVNVLTKIIENVVSNQTGGRSVALISSEIQQAKEAEANRLFDELSLSQKS